MTINASAVEKIVLFGDSLMAGYGLKKEDHLSTILENELTKKGYDIKIINASVSGDTSSGGLNKINWTLSEKDIDILILGLGANDMLRGIKPEETKKNLEEIIKITLNKKINLILAGMVAPTSYGEIYKKEFWWKYWEKGGTSIEECDYGDLMAGYEIWEDQMWWMGKW